MDIWLECKDRITLQPLDTTMVRVVESQEQIATNSLVDSLQEQELLEQMLEQTKPPLPAPGLSLHYLLTTPFRYPPLQHGSRFSAHYEASLFYGSHSVPTALAESAFYRFLFWRGMQETPPSGKFTTQHTIFGVRYLTQKGVRLQHQPYSDYVEMLTDPQRYVATQALGSAMREYGIEAFEYQSARDPGQGINAALFTPAALASAQPLFQQPWLCETSNARVSYYSARDGSVYQYPLETFLIKGVFPQPAQ